LTPQFRRAETSQRGQAIIIVLITLLVLLGAVGLAVDGGYAYYTSSRADTAAFAAAEAAGRLLPDRDGAAREAEAMAGLNGYSPSQVRVAFRPPGPSPTVVEVTVTQSSKVFFLQLLGAGRSVVISRSESSRPRPVAVPVEPTPSPGP
jgi:Flp pilus assembly protein TadG